MKKRIFILCLCCLILLCAIYHIDMNAPEPITTIETTFEPTTTAETTFPDFTTAPPDYSLHIDAGSYFLRYHDEITEDYLDYYVFIPENATIEMPLVVFLHGDGEVGKPEKLEDYSMIKQARKIYGNDFPFIAISPCTRTTSWTKSTISQTLKGLIDYVVDAYSIDPNHICISGHSRGGIGVWNMISTYGDYFSSAIIVSSISAGKLDIENCAKVPIMAFAGTDDDLELQCQNATKRYINRIQKLSNDATFTLLKGCTHGQTKDAAFSKETFDWILSHKKEG